MNEGLDECYGNIRRSMYVREHCKVYTVNQSTWDHNNDDKPAGL